MTTKGYKQLVLHKTPGVGAFMRMNRKPVRPPPYAFIVKFPDETNVLVEAGMVIDVWVTGERPQVEMALGCKMRAAGID